MSEWPGYTPPASGSSANCGTPPLSSYVNREAAIKAQYAADGADVSQEPPQYYGNYTIQKRNEPEGHGTPGVPGTPVATLGGAGTATVTWAASVPPPSLSYVIKPSTGAAKTVKPTATSATLTGLAAGATTFTVQAVNNLSSSAASAASNSVTVT
ncbi:fibronectin type III domain-containing protein [Streptomyces sp. NPDC005551]|uniref:fibronectin type III domain-containing protein n=1 Tax=Streptomyces sp. NPDC005551 TaxID=3364725 RepID=UPI0036CA2E36